MQLINLDLFTLKKILKKERVSSWAIAKSFPWKEREKFCQMTKNQLNEFFAKKERMIEYRLRMMCKENFILKEGETFIVDIHRVKLSHFKFLTGKRESLEIMFSDGKCRVFEI